MRRSVLVMALAALLVAPLMALMPNVASAATSAPEAGPSPATMACLANAIENHVAPTDALNTCLDPSRWSPAVGTSAALAGLSCSQAVQDPFSLDGLTLHWGTLMVCDQNAVMVFSGLGETSGGVIVGAGAGSGQPAGNYIQFWDNITACPLPGYYRSVITSATASTLGGKTANLLLATGRNAFVNCIA
jgi:hypothetical protein